MASSGINTGFAKCFILFMALVILLQGFIYLALSLWGLVLTSCNNQHNDLLEGDISGHPLRFFFDMVYFKNENCGNRTIDINNETYILNVDWTQSAVITHRELIILITYVTTSALWIISSLLVIATLCGQLTVLSTVLCFWPWFIFVIAGCVLDVVATVYHGIDITHTTTANDSFSYVGLENIGTNVQSILDGYDTYYMIPAVVMASISSRAVLIWLLNAFGAIYCIALCQAIINKQQKRKIRRNLATTSGIELNMEIARNVEQEPTAPTTSSAVVSDSGSARVPYASNGVQIAVRTEPDSTYRNTDAHPARLNYPKMPTPVTPAALSFASPLNNRYSSMEAMPTSPQRVSAELRNQMPWSYTNAQQQQEQQQQQQQRQ